MTPAIVTETSNIRDHIQAGKDGPMEEKKTAEILTEVTEEMEEQAAPAPEAEEPPAVPEAEGEEAAETVETGLPEDAGTGAEEGPVRDPDTARADYFDSLSEEDRIIYLKLQRAKRARKLRMRRRRQLVSLIVIALLVFAGYKGYKVVRAFVQEKMAERAAYEKMMVAGDETTDGDNELVKLAVREIGNEGGEKYWKWWGFESQINWGSVFIAWLGAHVDDSIGRYVPQYANVEYFVEDFKASERWLEPGRAPLPGYLIFFDFADPKTGERDGIADHTGLVTGTKDKRVFTIEGNVGYAEHGEGRDAGDVFESDWKGDVRRKGYDVDDPDILGYGVVGEFPVYDEDL